MILFKSLLGNFPKLDDATVVFVNTSLELVQPDRLQLPTQMTGSEEFHGKVTLKLCGYELVVFMMTLIVV